MAPGRMLEHLFEQAPDAYEVTIFNAEPRVNYNRLMLSPVLSGEKTYEAIITHGDDWYAKHNVTLHKGRRIDAIDRVAKTVTAADGTVADYDKLVDEAFVTDPRDTEKLKTIFRKAMEIWLPDLPDIQLVQNFHRIPMNTTYWTNWPTAENAYVNGASWHLTHAMVLWNLKPTS